MNRKYIESNFIDNEYLLKDDFKKYFSCESSYMYIKLKELGISYKSRKSYVEFELLNIVSDGIPNDRKIIKPLELDVYSEKYNFAIEYNGLIPHSYGYHRFSPFDNIVEDPKRHLFKTEECEKKGIQLYHIFENEWKEKKNIWVSMIDDKQGLNKKVGARKTKIKELSSNDAKTFINENHMQGYINASIKIGFYHNNVLISIMTFGKSRYNKNMEYELLRFCTKKGITVQGGGSKMLKYFERNYNPTSLISYANRRWSNGNFYEKVGFKFSHNTPPNFFYFKPEEGILWSRNKFQKHKQKKLLEDYSSERTGTENMYFNGYRKIFDSGNKVYVKRYNIPILKH